MGSVFGGRSVLTRPVPAGKTAEDKAFEEQLPWFQVDQNGGRTLWRVLIWVSCSAMLVGPNCGLPPMMPMA